MTPRAYATAQRLAVDPGATPAERENAAQRCREYEARHGRPAAPAPPPLFSPWRRPGGEEHDMRDLCATCGKDWALHWIAYRLDDVDMRPESRPCAHFVPKMKPPRRKPRLNVQPVPWWTLSVSMASTGKRLGLTYAFRCALRELRNEIGQSRERVPRGIYAAPPETVEHIERGEVDWRWFPDWRADRGWRPPPEMRAAMRAKR